jgi:hypothetical protein
LTSDFCGGVGKGKRARSDRIVGVQTCSAQSVSYLGEHDRAGDEIQASADVA